MESVYIETTIISYLVARPSSDLLVAAHQHTTEEWWTNRRHEFECCISQIVIDEISAGNPEIAKKRMKIINNFAVLDVTEEAEQLTMLILAEGAMPTQEVRDAAHIAVAAVNNMDYLLTWNCKHLANAQIIRRISVICNRQGYNMPVICTPEELMGE
jgi:predicted nucleic acid-binding protein